MLRTTRVGVLSAALGATFTAATAAAQAPAPPTYSEGDVVRFAIEARSVVEQGEQRYELAQRATLTCRAVERSTVETRFDCAIDQLEAQQRQGERVERFAHPLPQGQDEPPRSAFFLLNAALVEEGLRVFVPATGGVSRVEGYTQVARAMAQAPEAGAALLGALGPSSAAANLAPVFGGDLPRADELGEDGRWRRRREVDAGPGRRLVFDSRWRVAAHEGRRWRLAAQTDVSLEQERAPGALAVQGEILESDARVETVWEAGRLVERNSTLRMTTRFALGGATVEQTLDSSVQLRGLAAAEAENAAAEKTGG